MSALYPRLSPLSARTLAGHLHAGGAPQLMGTYADRRKAVVRRCTYRDIPAFEGLGVKFVVREVPRNHPQFDPENSWGVWAETDPTDTENVVHLPDGRIALLLFKSNPSFTFDGGCEVTQSGELADKEELIARVREVINEEMSKRGL